ELDVEDPEIQAQGRHDLRAVVGRPVALRVGQTGRDRRAELQYRVVLAELSLEDGKRDVFAVRAHTELDRVHRTSQQLFDHELERYLLLHAGAQRLVARGSAGEVSSQLVLVMDDRGQQLADAGARLDDRRVADLDEGIQGFVQGTDHPVTRRRDVVLAQDVA